MSTASPARGGAPGPLVAPARERAEHRHQLACALGQLVVDAGRDLAVALAGQHAVGDHPIQPRAQLLGGDSRQHALQLDEPARTGGKVTDDQERPFIPHEIEGTGIRRPLVVRMALRWWYLGDRGSRCWSAPYLPTSSLTKVPSLASRFRALGAGTPRNLSGSRRVCVIFPPGRRYQGDMGELIVLARAPRRPFPPRIGRPAGLLLRSRLPVLVSGGRARGAGAWRG